MKRLGLQIRMLAVALVLLGVYLAVAWVLVALVREVTWWSTPDIGFVAAAVVGITLGFAWGQYTLGCRVAVASVGARELPADRYPVIYRMVEELSDRLDVDQPRVMVARMGVPNAFAVGRRGNSTIVLSLELLWLLDRAELEGVIAHELAHVRNRDSVLMTMTASLRKLVTAVVSAFVLVGVLLLVVLVEAVSLVTRRENADVDWGTLGGVATLYATTMVLAVLLLFTSALSRHREYVADATAAQVLDDPRALASALRRIEAVSGTPLRELGPLGTERRRDDSLPDVFSTHPSVEERVQYLQAAAEVDDPEPRRIPIQ